MSTYAFLSGLGCGAAVVSVINMVAIWLLFGVSPVRALRRLRARRKRVDS